MQYSVFDIADHLISKTKNRSMSGLKLQKLCFYAFGWYAHQTGTELFSEKFYALPLGPVVTDLLSAHEGQKVVSQADLQTEFETRGTSPSALDPYTLSVLDAVWEGYGDFSSSQLVDMTHEEDVWITSWEGRPTGSARAPMRKQDVVEYFFLRKMAPAPGKLKLPDARVSVEDSDFLDSLEEIDTRSPASYFSELQKFLQDAA